MNSDLFQDRELPPMSAEMFATLVVVRLRSLRGIVVQDRRGLEFEFRIGNRAQAVHLDSYYQRYRDEPAALTPIIQELVENLAEGAFEYVPPEAFEQVAPRLLPRLMNSGEWQQKRESGIRPVIRPLVQDLGIALVIDGPAVMTYVQLEAVAGWGLDMNTAYETAMSNLERRTQGISYSQIGEGRETLLIDRAGDGYAATRAILPSRLEAWSKQISGELLLGLPTGDFLIGFSREHPGLAGLREQVAQDARTHEHGLMPQLLVYRSGVLRVLEEAQEGD